VSGTQKKRKFLATWYCVFSGISLNRCLKLEREERREENIHKRIVIGDDVFVSGK